MTGAEHFVSVAGAAIAKGNDILATVGLGSCVAILLHDPLVRVAGMAHVLLPAPHGTCGSADMARYATTAVPFLLQEMVRGGADRTRVNARIVGGANLFGSSRSVAVIAAGERNLEAVRDALEWAAVPVVGEEVGRDHGRSVRMRAADGRVVVTAYRRPDVVL